MAATHQDEVQVITTAAPVIVGVQLMTTSADEGDTVEGHFALQFPEIQTVTLFSSAEVTSGNFSLTYTAVWANDSTGVLSSDSETTACIDWNAEAEDVSWFLCSCRCCMVVAVVLNASQYMRDTIEPSW